MRIQAGSPVGMKLELGNAWDSASPPQITNWIIGTGPNAPGMRQVPAEMHVQGLGVKWFVHRTTDDPTWGTKKPTSEGKTFSMLASNGAFELKFIDETSGQSVELVLDTVGDFVIWEQGLQHSWKPIADSTIMTVRWKEPPSE